MKKILSCILVAAMLLTVLVVPAAAAGVTDFALDTVLTAGKLGAKDGVYVDVKVKSGTTAVGAVVDVVVYDSTVLELVNGEGTAVTIADVDTNHADAMIEYLPASTGMDSKFSNVYVYGLAGNDVAVAVCTGTMNPVAIADSTSVAKYFLALKSGKTMDDVNANVLRQGTAAEAATLNQDAAVLIDSVVDDENIRYDYLSNIGADADGFANQVTFGKDFAFAPEPLPDDVAVTLDGTVQDGSKVTANVANAPANATATYKWYLGTDEIAGATTNEYTPTAADALANKKLKVVVTFSGYSGSVEAESAAAVGKDPAKDGKATTIEITSGASILVIPTGDTPATETYEATVKDGYGVVMPDAAVTWSFTDSATPSGATFDPATATLSAAKEIAGGTVKVKVSVNGATPAVEKEIEVLVTSIDFNGKDAVTAKDNLVYGVGWDNIINGLSGLSVKVPAGVTGTFSIKEKAANTLPAAGTNTYHVVFNGTGYTDVPVKDVEVTIAQKPVTVKADDLSIYVKGAFEEADMKYTVTGLLGEDKLTGTYTYTIYKSDDEGEKTTTTTLTAINTDTSTKALYFVTPTGLTDVSGNYKITFVDGTLTVKKKSSGSPAFGQGTAPSGTDTTAPTPVENPEFNDVKEGDWFYDSVMAVAKKGLMTGTADKVFSPTLNTTRAQIATILWREAGSPMPKARIADFPDVADGAWYADAVRWCTEQEIVNGFDDGTFRPNDNITREQMVAMMYRYADKTGMDVSATADLADFADADTVGTWAVPYVEWAVGSKLIQGKGEGNLDPQGLATRAEVATILQRFVEMGK